MLLTLIKFSKLSIPKDKKTWSLCLIMGMLNNVIPFCLIAWGQLHTTCSIASILLAAVPIFTVFLAPIFISTERIMANKMIGAIIGLIGVYIMIRHTIQDDFSWEGYGQIAILFASMSYAFAAIWGRKLGQTPPIINATCMLCCSSFILLPIIFIFENPLTISANISTVLAVLSLSFLSTVIGFIIYFRLLADIGAINLSLLAFLIPITSLTLGIILLNEHLEQSSIVGMIIIALGLVLIDGRLLRYIGIKREVS